MEGDDFIGVRNYVLGESQRHIDWKAAARGQSLLIKQFAGETEEDLDFDWAAFSEIDYERRISQFTLWVIEAERRNRNYGLKLPTVRIVPSRGKGQYHRCLIALALMTSEEK